MMEHVGTSRGTALSLMGELVTLGVAERDETEDVGGFEGQQQPKSIRLADQHKWLLGIHD
jgi:hypothetical protein